MKWHQWSDCNRSDCKKPLHCKNVLSYFELQKKVFYVLFLFTSACCWLFLVAVRIAMNLRKSLTADETYDTYVDFNDDLELDINILIRKASC